MMRVLTVVCLIVAGCLPVAADIIATTNADTLAAELVGPGVSIVAGSAHFTGAAGQAGTFVNGAMGVGFNSGIVLTSGNVATIQGPNNNGVETLGVQNFTDDDVSTDMHGAGDGQLSALVGGAATYDAAVLEFDFEFDSSLGGDLYFNFVFASEEYIDYVGSAYNDVFGFFVDGQNIALVPGTTSPITINNINPNSHAALYRNNVLNTNGYPVLAPNLGFDGLTTVIQASKLGLSGESHHMKFAVADTSDHILDAGVFLQAGTFSNTPTPPDGVPEPSTWLLIGSGMAILGLCGRKRKRA